MTFKNMLILLALGSLALVWAGCGDCADCGHDHGGAGAQPAATIAPAAPATPADDQAGPDGGGDDTPSTEAPTATEPDADGAMADAEAEAAMAFALADLSDILHEAIIYTANIQGDPYTSGSLFSVDVALASPHEDPPMSFALRIHYHGDYARLEKTEAVESGFPRPIAGPMQGAGAEAYSFIMSSGNLSNTKKNLTMCRLFFRVIATPDEPWSIRLADDSNNVALPSVALKPLLHEYSNAATDPLPRPGEDADG